MEITREDIENLKKSIIDGLSDGFKKIPYKDASGNNIGDYTYEIDQGARNEYMNTKLDAEDDDKINELQRKIDKIEANFGNTRYGKQKANALRNEQERIRNGGVSKADVKKFQGMQIAAYVQGIAQIGNAIIDIIVAGKMKEIAETKANLQYTSKIIQLNMERQSKVVERGMKGITSGFSKNVVDLAYEAVQGSHALAKTSVQTKADRLIAEQTLRTDMLQAQVSYNSAMSGAIVAGAAGLGLIIGAAVAVPVGAIVGAIIGAIGGLITNAITSTGEIQVARAKVELDKARLTSDLMKATMENLHKFTEPWDKLYKETTDFVLKVNEAGVKFGTTLGWYGSYGQKFANTMLVMTTRSVGGTGKALAQIFGEEAEKIPEYMNAYIEASGRSVGMSVNDAGNVMATSRLFGMSGQEASTLYGSMNVFNTSISSASDTMGIMYQQITRMGLSSKKFGKDLVQNLKLAQKYNFKGGVDNMMKLTKWAQQTRFNLNSAASFADSIMNDSLSGALEKSARLQVLGGAAAIYSDPLGMLYDAGADVGNLAKRQAAMFSDISGTFNSKTGETDFSWYENRMLAARAQAMGMDVGEVKDMIRQNNKQSVIDKVLGNSLSEEDRLAIGNRATFNKKENRWEVVDVNGKTHDIKEYTENKANINDLLPKETDESILKVASRSLSVQEEINASMTYLKDKLGVAESSNIFADVKKNMETNEKFYRDSWNGIISGFNEARDYSNQAFENNIKMMETGIANIGMLKQIYDGDLMQVKELMKDENIKLFKDASLAYAIGTDDLLSITQYMMEHEGSTAGSKWESYQDMSVAQLYAKGLMDMASDGKFSNSIRRVLNMRGESDETIDNTITTAVNNALERANKRLEELRQITQNDGVGSTGGGMITGANAVKSINDGAVNVKTASDDQYLAARPNGPVDKILQRLIPKMQALIRRNRQLSNRVRVNFDGNIGLSQNGSTVNLIDIIKHNPTVATQIVALLTKAMETNQNGRAVRNHMIS